MAWPLVALALYQGYSAWQAQQAEEEGLKTQQAYREKISTLNNRLSGIYADQAIKEGEEVVSQIRREKTKILGAQKVSLAAQGISVSSGSAADVLAETELNAELDVITAKNQAWKKAWGIKVETEKANLESRMMSAATENQIANSILTRNLNISSSLIQAYGYKSKTPSTTTTQSQPSGLTMNLQGNQFRSSSIA